MGTNQHLLRSLVAIRDEGGLQMASGERLLPAPVLIGRDPVKLAALAARAGDVAWSTDLDAVLADPAVGIYFDAQTTARRGPDTLRAIAAGKHVYCEKPSGTTTAEAMDLYFAARDAGVRHGVVQDKLYLPGLLQLKALIDAGWFGEIVSVRGEFGYWVFTGHDETTPQRPSWNYRREDGGGIIVDMLCHWRYVLDHLFGAVRSVSCLGATHIRERIDEAGRPYRCTADDAAYATFELENGVVAHFNSSWTTRVRRDDLLTLQVDGTRGSAVAGLRGCVVQSAADTPRPVWNPDIDSPIDFRDGWSAGPFPTNPGNAFRIQWESFLRHVVDDAPWSHGLREGAKGVQLAEAGLRSWAERRWVDLDPLPE
ncbi:MAG: Gfo/Idh/MocA family protein [Armatimonadota bacterium]